MIYLDYSATTPVNELVLESFNKVCRDYIGNPNSLHKLGVDAKRLMDKATEQIANLLKVSSDEVIFTSGATEANNLAIKGYALKNINRGKHIITSIIEHPSVLECFSKLEKEGYKVKSSDFFKIGIPFTAVAVLSGAILADLYNGTLFTDCLKGWFNIIFMMLLIPFAYWLLSDNPKRFLWYYLGQAISSLYSFYFIRSSFMDESSYEIWVVYAWYNILNAIGALLYYKGWHKLSLTYLICLAFYFLFKGSRNIFLVSLLSVCVLYVIGTVNTKKLNVLNTELMLRTDGKDSNIDNILSFCLRK